MANHHIMLILLGGWDDIYLCRSPPPFLSSSANLSVTISSASSSSSLGERIEQRKQNCQLLEGYQLYGQCNIESREHEKEGVLIYTFSSLYRVRSAIQYSLNKRS